MEPKQPRQQDDTPEPTQEELEPYAGDHFSRDLNRINTAIIELLSDQLADPADLRQAWSARANLVEQHIRSLETMSYSPDITNRVQLEMMVDKAAIFEAVGNTIRYLEELDDAEVFALNRRDDDVAIVIGEELDKKIKDLGSSPEELVLKLRGLIEFQNRDRLRDMIADGMSYEDLLDSIETMVISEGGDPREVLQRLGVAE